MKRIMFVAMAVICCVAMAAQSKISVKFDEQTHDFGTLREEQGKATTIFTFVNNSDVPVSLKNVRASCGCTTPNWSKAPVAPGQKGEITVTYNTNGRPGSFQKSITVQVGTDAETVTEALRIVGKVTPRPKTPEETYPHKLSTLRAREEVVDFGSIFKGATQERDWEVYNTDTKAHVITFSNVPAHILVTTPKVTVTPGKEAKVTFRYNTEKTKKYWVATDKISVLVDGKPAGTVSIRSCMKENFTQLTDAQRQKAPICEITPSRINFTNVRRGEQSKTLTFEIKNNGQEIMHIRALHSEDPHIKVSATKTQVHPNKSTVVTVSLESASFKPSHYNRNIQIVTNDPVNTITKLVVEFTITE